jgi:hypothetical protein
MVTQYRLPNNARISLVIKYKGEVKKDDFFNDNPDIKAIFKGFTKDVLAKHEMAKEQTELGKTCIIEVSENGVILNCD